MNSFNAKEVAKDCLSIQQKFPVENIEEWDEFLEKNQNLSDRGMLFLNNFIPIFYTFRSYWLERSSRTSS